MQLDFLSSSEPNFTQHKFKVPLQHSQVGQESKSKGGPLTSLSRMGQGAGVLKDREPKEGPVTPSLPMYGLLCPIYYVLLPSTTSTLQKILFRVIGRG